jgi:rare lipoprotein A (peptidoglycan hydrolase)
MENYYPFEKKPFIPNPKIGIWIVLGVVFMLLIMLPFFIDWAHAEQVTPSAGYATWYSVASCLREGTSGIMANGRRLNDEAFTCASWYYRFGTRLLVRNLSNGKSCVVVVSDRGPAKRLVKKGKIIDLSKVAFSSIAELKKGVISVEVEVLK